jgi:hypothetical protein
MPDVVDIAKENRAFLTRMARFVASQADVTRGRAARARRDHAPVHRGAARGLVRGGFPPLRPGRCGQRGHAAPRIHDLELIRPNATTEPSIIEVVKWPDGPRVKPLGLGRRLISGGVARKP